MFVRFDCGCVGLRLEDIDYVIEPCDYSSGEDIGRLCFYERDVSDKQSKPLTKAERKHLVMRIGRLIHEGQALSRIRYFLKEPTPLPSPADVEQQLHAHDP